MAIRSRTVASLGIGVLTYFLVRKSSRQQRRRALRDAIHADYALAGTDAEFMAEMAEIERDFAGTLNDGLAEAGEY